MRPTVGAVLGALSIALAACTGDAGDREPCLEEAALPIVGGEPSTTAEDATVMLAHDGEFACTGTLLAANLVLTARHCVSLVARTGACGVAGQNLTPRSITVSVGVKASVSGWSARGARLFTTKVQDLCGNDLALIKLDREIPDARTAKVRFTAIEVGEMGTVVGYGHDASGEPTPGRYRRKGVKIAAIGPSTYLYRTSNGGPLEVEVPKGDFAGGESTCFGDSGGPIFDASGRILGVTSRGIDQACVDRPTLFATVLAHRELIEEATRSAEQTTVASPHARGDDDEEPAGRHLHRAQTASAGCGVADASSRDGVGPLMLVALAACARRRRPSVRPRPSPRRLPSPRS